MTSTVFNEKIFINSVISDISDNTYVLHENVLRDKYIQHIGFNTEKENQIYSLYQNTFIKKWRLLFGNNYYVLEIPGIKTTWCNCTPSLFDIMRHKMKQEIENKYYSDADTDNED